MTLVADCRWNEWGTRYWSHSEYFPWVLIVTQKSQIGDTFGSDVRTDHNKMSQNAAHEVQLVSQQNIAQAFSKLV